MTVARIGLGEVVLQLQNLSRYYGRRCAVNHLNLSVHRADIFGFLGPNGAGKTTTIRMILGLVTPTDGRISILGQDMVRQHRVVLPRVGALIEMPALYPYLSGRDNLVAIGSSTGGVTRKRVEAVLELVGLQERQKDRVSTYSLGMKQRLGVAIALLHDPEILILDEPANGLDPVGIVEMRNLLQSLSERGKTIFLSSHLLAEIQQTCTRVAIINQGKLVIEGQIDELIRKPGEYAVKVERPYEAFSAIKQQQWGQHAYLDSQGTIITSAPQASGRDLCLFLVTAGFVPESLTPTTQDLEQIFLQHLSPMTNAGLIDRAFY